MYLVVGSFPLMRGKLDGQVASQVQDRLIPAHAGKTVPGPARWRVAGAHPPSRGENVVTVPRQAGKSGSSPLTRGKLGRDLGHGQNVGLIPAHAGKTWCASARPQRSRAHPRSCGKNIPPARFCRASAGSSPLTRGKLWIARAWASYRGLIPAHTRKTRCATPAQFGRRAHPPHAGKTGGGRSRGG